MTGVGDGCVTGVGDGCVTGVGDGCLTGVGDGCLTGVGDGCLTGVICYLLTEDWCLTGDIKLNRTTTTQLEEDKRLNLERDLPSGWLHLKLMDLCNNYNRNPSSFPPLQPP